MAELVDDIRSRSWFCVFNNPEEHGFIGSSQEICDNIVSAWVDGFPTRSCAVTYCISSEGLKHCHVVLEDNKVMRFSAVKKAFPSMHIEPTKGNKEQAEDYINKRGKWEEKGEQIISTARYGEIKGAQGQRRDFEIIEDLIFQGLTPNEIFNQSFSFRRYDKYVKQAYYDKRVKETPVLRPVTVYWHVGESGSGKTYTYVQLCEQYGENNVYLLNDYDKGGFDNYNGQKILCMDEFRGQMRFQLLLNYLQGYKIQLPCRYANSFALWDEVHIFTVLPPELVYQKMVDDNQHLDTYSQLKNRIDYVVFHQKIGFEYQQFSVPMSQYKSYDDLRRQAFKNVSFEQINISDFEEFEFENVPFDQKNNRSDTLDK